MTQVRTETARAPKLARPHAFWWTIILFGMTLTGVLAFNDAAFASWSGNVTTLLPQGVIQGIFVVACAIHLSEALVALKLAASAPEKAGSPLGWFVQTLLLGYASLGLLRKRLR